MKLTTVIATLVLGAAAVSVKLPATETNAERLARGLPPLPPVRRGTAVAGARRSGPSSTPSCNTGPVQCCNTVTNANNPATQRIIGLLGIVVGPNVIVGLNCSPVSVIGIGGSSCSQQTVCCQNNNFNGLIVIGCTPININL